MWRLAETLQLPMLKITHRVANKVVEMDWLEASDSNLLGGFNPWDFPALNLEKQKAIRDLTCEWTDHHNSSTNPTIAETRVTMREGRLVPVLYKTQLQTVVGHFELFTNVCWGEMHNAVSKLW